MKHVANASEAALHGGLIGVAFDPVVGHLSMSGTLMA